MLSCTQKGGGRGKPAATCLKMKEKKKKEKKKLQQKKNNLR